MLLPIDAKIDKNGLLYIDNDAFKRYPLNLNYNLKISNLFYSLLNTDDYIIKYSLCSLKQEQLIQMLMNFKKLQKNINDTDFPIGYYKEDDFIRGQIIKYYKNSPTLFKLIKEKDINIFGKYYYHDDDSIHNLYMIMLDILDLLEELFNNGVYYTDIHSGNFVIHNNQIKLIDFDYNFIHFMKNIDKELLDILLWNYSRLFFYVNKVYNLGNFALDECHDFKYMKKYVKSMENHVRRG